MEIVRLTSEYYEEVVGLHCPKWRELSLEDRLTSCGYWGDPGVFSWYLDSLIRAGGQALVALEDGKVLGEAELVPERFSTPVGTHTYLQMVWVRKEARKKGVGRALVKECSQLSRKMRIFNLDTIPRDEAIPFFERLGFKEVDTQILMEAETRPAPEELRIEDADREEFPVSALMVAGQTRPSALLWELLWEREKVGLPSPRVIKVRVGMWQFVIALTQPFPKDDFLYALVWAPHRAGLGQIFDSMEAAISIAYEMGYERVRTQTWCRYRAAFEGAGFTPMKRFKWMRKRL